MHFIIFALFVRQEAQIYLLVFLCVKVFEDLWKVVCCWPKTGFIWKPASWGSLTDCSRWQSIVALPETSRVSKVRLCSVIASVVAFRDGLRGTFTPMRLFPPFLPSQSAEKMTKIGYFWQISGFLPPQKCILPSWCLSHTKTSCAATWLGAWYLVGKNVFNFF